MIDEKELRKLTRFQSDNPILSIYLNVDPTEHTSEEYLLSLRRILEEVEDEANPEDIAAVRRYFEHEYDWSGRGVIIFACVKADFWRVYPLNIPVASGATVARRPYLSPLAALMNAYGRYAVILVSRQDAQFFLFQLGELVEQQVVAGSQVRKLKKGRGSSGGPGRRGGAPISSRREEEMVTRNLREIAKEAARFSRRHKPQHMILAGAEPTVAQFRDLLPKSLRGKVIGSFGADPGTTKPELLERSLQIIRQAEETRKAEIVQAVFTAASKGREGVVGLDGTLSAAHEGRIRTLIIDRSYRAPGYRCDHCDYLTTQALDTCPFCGGKFIEIPDAAEAVVTKVIEEGGNVEVVDQNPQLAPAGVGALLRY